MSGKVRAEVEREGGEQIRRGKREGKEEKMKKKRKKKMQKKGYYFQINKYILRQHSFKLISSYM